MERTEAAVGTVLDAEDAADADGNLLRASAHENQDLFWALSGGGAGDLALSGDTGPGSDPGFTGDLG